MSTRILHVIGGLVGGGAETQVKLLAKGLEARGWPCGIAYLHDDPDFTDRGRITCIRIERGKKHDLIGLGHRVGEAIEQFQPDIVHTWLPEILTVPAALYARRRGIPCLSAQRFSLQHSAGTKSFMRGWLGFFAHVLADRFVSNFPCGKEPWLARKVIARRQGEVIRNGVSQSEITPAERPEWLRQGAFKLFFVGRLARPKRVDLLIEAVASLRSRGYDLQLAVYGKGEQEEALRELARKSGLGDDAIRFLGYRTDWQREAVYYDLFVLPSMVEGMPNALVEAMRTGVATLASDIYEISTLVEDGVDSLLFRSGSCEALSEVLQRLMLDDNLRASLSRNALMLVERLSTESMVDAYIGLYTQMLKDAGRGLKGVK